MKIKKFCNHVYRLKREEVQKKRAYRSRNEVVLNYHRRREEDAAAGAAADSNSRPSCSASLGISDRFSVKLKFSISII